MCLLHELTRLSAYRESGYPHMRVETWRCEECGRIFRRFWDETKQKWTEPKETKMSAPEQVDPVDHEYLVWWSVRGKANPDEKGTITFSVEVVGIRAETSEDAAKKYASSISIKQSLNVCVLSVETGCTHTFEVEPVTTYKTTRL